jgi:hypothetical protein
MSAATPAAVRRIGMSARPGCQEEAMIPHFTLARRQRHVALPATLK